jgi:regulator of cell morphogenesis and NO signaling
MPLDITKQATSLNDHIQTRFHEGHRRALPGLLTLAAWAEARNNDSGLVDAMRAIGNAIEQHMFNEAMHPFRMMEYGGNALIECLSQGLPRQHDLHENTIDEIRTRLPSLALARREDPTLRRLILGVEDLVNELLRHICAEEAEPFPLFATPASPGSPSNFNPWSPATTTS